VTVERRLDFGPRDERHQLATVVEHGDASVEMHESRRCQAELDRQDSRAQLREIRCERAEIVERHGDLGLVLDDFGDQVVRELVRQLDARVGSGRDVLARHQRQARGFRLLAGTRAAREHEQQQDHQAHPARS